MLQLAPDAVAGGPIFPGEEAASGMLGARRVTVAELEAKEVATLRLKLTDDKILESTVGKTPVMVLQEHCHKHVGRVPTYTDVTEAAANRFSRNSPQKKAQRKWKIPKSNSERMF